MSELRLYLRRESLQEGTDCAWVLLDDTGQIRGSGSLLEDLPQEQRCRLVLAGELVLNTTAPLPDLPERRLAPLLAAAAEASILVDADSVHASLMARGEDGNAVIAVIDAAWLSRMLDKLAALGVRPDSALPDYLLLPWVADSWSVGWQGSSIVARYGRAEGMSLDEGDPPVGLILALPQQGRPTAVRIYQGDHLGAPDLQRWRDALGTEVEAAAAWDWRTAPWPDLPNLLQGRFLPMRGRMDWSRLAKTVAAGMVLLAGIQLAGTALDWALLARESNAIRQEMRVLAERVLPAHAAVVDPPWQVSERIKELRSVAGKPAADSLMGLLGRLGQVWPMGAVTQVKTLSYEANTLTLSVSGTDASWLDRLKAGANASGLEITAQEGKDKEVSLSVRPEGKDERHAQ